MKVFGITGWKNSGKTRLMVRLIEHFSNKGMQVATLKRAHCEFDIDRENTDSFAHRKAGAREVLISSDRRWALMHELEEESEELRTEMLLGKLSDGVDLVLIEGFKLDTHPKIQVIRPEINKEPMPEEITNMVALVSDSPVQAEDFGQTCPVFDVDDIDAIARLILDNATIVR